jgi:hypothetical protein
MSTIQEAYVMMGWFDSRGRIGVNLLNPGYVTGYIFYVTGYIFFTLHLHDNISTNIQYFSTLTSVC